MAETWADVNRRIREARASSDPLGKLLELFDTTGDGHVAYNLGEEYERRGALTEAQRWYREAEVRYPLEARKESARMAGTRVQERIAGLGAKTASMQRDQEFQPELRAVNDSVQRVQEFRLLRRLGSGGFGQVFLAEDETLRRLVALKVLTLESGEARERFRREAVAAASVDHPNVVNVYRAFSEGERLVIAMEYVPGGDLNDWLEETGPLEISTAVNLIEAVAEGLDAAHAHGLVHRDLKPANILLRQRHGKVHAIVTDFGISKDTNATTLTQTGDVFGTVRFMAPEQAEGKPVTPATDVYALALVFFQAVTGHLPFLRQSTVATLVARLSEEPPSVREFLPDASEALDAVVHRALSRAPADRYQRATEFAEALGEAASAGEAGGTPTADGWQRRPDLDAPELTYHWPTGPEEFDGLEVWAAPPELGGLFGVARARARGVTFGRPRASFGVFLLDQHARVIRHVVSFSEDDEGGYVSLVRGYGGGRGDFAPDDNLPPGYDRLTIAVHRDRVRGGYNRLAVVTGEDSVYNMMIHAALQVRLRQRK